MYDYIALRIKSTPCNEDITDLLAAFLADEGYDTFEPDSEGLSAYIRKDRFTTSAVDKIITDFPIPTTLSYSFSEIKGEDWNREWEQNYFKPILIEDKLVVRSSFHTDFPGAPIEIIIDPKMAFGTGHHATTAGMATLLLEEDLKGQSVIDMGTGTGILAILAAKLGSLPPIGIDIDEFAIENAVENGNLNNVDATWIVGDDEALHHLKPASIFLANINLNVISDNLSNYLKALEPEGKIFLSGFLVSDRVKIMELTSKNRLKLLKEKSENGWLAMLFQREE